MMRLNRIVGGLVIATLTLTACASGGRPGASRAGGMPVGPVEQVRAAEMAFAKALADRDFDAFVSHLSRDAIFFGERSVQHGVAEVSAAWKPLFSTPNSPFSWAPDHVEVLSSGNLALSTGPVFVDGKVVGRFNSVWRLEERNSWRIVFDKGEAVCATPTK
jgi:ketosteroid isomerase-like protein